MQVFPGSYLIMVVLFCDGILKTCHVSCLAPTVMLNKHVSKCHVERRSFMITCSTLFPVITNPFVAIAAYGDSTNIEFPNYIEFLIEKNKSVDPSTFLYKGADPAVLLNRLLLIDKKLAEIPQLAAEKKWSQVQGILTGPLGNLAETLNLIAKDAQTPDVQSAVKKVKSDVFSIGTAATKKDSSGCTTGAKSASLDLATFAKLAFK